MFKIDSRTGSRIAALFAALLLPVAVWAQGAPTAVLVYADNESAVKIMDADGFGRDAFIGDEILAGETLKTVTSTAEIKLTPNGTIVKVARNTSFKVEALAGAPGKDTNEFALLGGKIRTVASRTSTTNAYRIRTPTAVCGVRGTDFSMIVQEGARDAVYVKRGMVEFSRTLADGALESVMVGAGQFADAFAASFAAAQFDPAQFAAESEELEFTGVDPAAVDQGEEPAAEAPAEEPVVAEAPPVVETRPATEEEVEAVKKDSESKVMGWLGEVLGFEIGSIVINEQTYSKAVIQPTFKLGKANIGLYIPIIYTSDLFNPDDWYHPAGNDEWSFGSEHWSDDPLAATGDAIGDLMLKIRFVEYGDRYVDPLYFNIGNLNSMTIGHGVIMRNFANDADFPAVRRVGLNTGIDRGFWGAEAVVNDLASPEIFGGRVKALWVLGLSVIADIDPAGDLPSAEREAVGDPIFLGTGVDLDLPILKLPFFSLRAFADAATLLPVTRNDLPGPDGVLGTADDVAAGAQVKAIANTDNGTGLEAFRNYGLVAGFLGKAIFIDWRLEYRNYRGAFRPSFFNSGYERNRGTYAYEYASLLNSAGMGTDAVTVNGIYGEAAFSIIKDKIVFNAGYMLPWSPDSTEDWVDIAANDYLLAKLEIRKGLIPSLDVAGAFSYERTGFMHALLGNASGVSLLDEKTVLKGEVLYPITKGVDFAVVLSTATSQDADGNVIYEDHKPLVEPTVTFETRIHF
ncbi:MAG: hypothetical protein A2001_00915 [Treponema sp. GWC1_61_84]|nr:MAG: hypothetical protein A2001_00915 [Treponema sp. GWC1_61_84]